MTKIFSAQAQVADFASLTRLLEDVPEAEEIRTELGQPYFTRRWQQSMGRGFWITSDGTTVECLTLSGFELDEMVAIWVSFDSYRNRADFKLTAGSLRDLIEAELGVSVELES